MEVRRPAEPWLFLRVLSSEQGRLNMFIARVHSMAYFLTKSRVRMAAESSVRSLARALARRDIPVPAGQSKIVAISR
jgi:hypothetical protein